jgi:hypothetical protein
MQSSKTEQPAPLLRDAKSRRALGEGVPAAMRLPYEKPVLRSISLVADQVLGVGCKQIPPMMGLRLGTDPVLGCLINNCKLIDGS